MHRQLQRAILIPANRTVLYDLEENNSIFLIPKIFQEYYMCSLFRFIGIKSVRFIVDPDAYLGNALIWNAIWKVLFTNSKYGYNIILYPDRDSDIDESELKERYQIMCDNQLAHGLVNGNQIHHFEDAIERYSINPFNSVFIATNQNLLNEFCDRYYPRDRFSIIVNGKGRTFYFETAYWNKNLPEEGLKYSVGQSQNLYGCLASIYSKNFCYSGRYLPFMENKYIYVEEGYSPEVNQYILNNYDKIVEIASGVGYEFIYFPKYVKTVEFTSFVNDYLQYFYPALKIDLKQLEKVIAKKLIGVDWQQYILELLNLPKLKHPAFITLVKYKDRSDPQQILLKYIQGNLSECIGVFFWYAGTMRGGSSVFYQLNKRNGTKKTPDSDYVKEAQALSADDNFKTEAHLLTDEVISKISYLKSRGMEAFLTEIALHLLQNLSRSELNRMGINSPVLTKELEQPKLSRLLIQWTSKFDFDIILPDYGNMMVEMPRLPKALYYFFLQHPEGILFTELCNYRQELIQIYSRVSNLSDKAEIVKNIDRLVDPLDNSINVNCSRIKSAFVKLIDDSLAYNYYINGFRGKRKKIGLSPNLIEIKDHQ